MVKDLHYVAEQRGVLFGLCLGRARELEADEDTAKTALIEERDELKDRCFDLQTSLLKALAKLGGQKDRETTGHEKTSSVPAPSEHDESVDPDTPIESTEGDNRTKTKGKSAKIADPERFTDGKTPRFTAWKGAMMRKLKGNADHYENEAGRFGYAVSWIGGQALELLEPYLEPGSVNEMTTVDEVMRFLEKNYTDPTAIRKAKNEFLDLKMEPAGDYRDFVTKFVHLAAKAGVAKEDWKDEFNRRLSARLQRGMMRDFIDDSVDFDEYQQLGFQFALQNSQLDKTTKTSSGGGTGKAKDKTREGSTAPATGGGRAKSATPAMTQEEKEQLMTEGKCFYCKEVGHNSRNCAKKLAARISRMQAQQQAQQQTTEPTQVATEQEN
ncbi:hypothetical protein C8A00DRAFT_19794 [Chaetomidium leptoderma]|uniref:CCHC-type domain-containing protein n=1 Tax=Chaetomidium leptoderma TaxID=669021 RepID=A0AAN6VBJ5_9PEZI|nr:hypothetical protein C8A00DRAFT_19794 [Chaetomidium leptoderma]